ncbi:C-type lectin lectoxin-Lio3-like [Mytilus californianus]|uniref:C-type lectin lectoxin-Lio3-like n=1 Tax=Mytilus californianus TaxID=6549 RepID=UPI002247F5E6|nr:C-type lectin lectoxin-Lio3-like [Mytilus californianus]
MKICQLFIILCFCDALVVPSTRQMPTPYFSLDQVDELSLLLTTVIASNIITNIQSANKTAAQSLVMSSWTIMTMTMMMMMMMSPGMVPMMVSMMATSSVLLAIGVMDHKSCPSDWFVHEDSCYFFSEITNSLTWNGAQEYCNERGAKLAEPETLQEGNVLKMEANNKYGVVDNGVWLGGNDMDTDGVWEWSSTNTPISTSESDWDVANGNPGSEPCMLLYLASGNRWRDAACDEEHAFICERV